MYKTESECNIRDGGITHIYIYIYIYIWKKKTNKLQVHPYKPVSWSPTHQGIKSPDEWATTKQVCLFLPYILRSTSMY